MNPESELIAYLIAAGLACFALSAVLFAAAAERRFVEGRPTEAELRRWIRKHRVIWGRRERL